MRFDHFLNEDIDQFRKEVDFLLNLEDSPLSSYVRSIYLHNQKVDYLDKGWNDIKNHRFFEHLDWGKLSRKEIEPPFSMQEIHDLINQNQDYVDDILRQKHIFKSKESKEHWEHFNPKQDVQVCDAFDEDIYLSCPSEEDRLGEDQNVTSNDEDNPKKVTSGGMIKQATNNFLLVVYTIYLQVGVTTDLQWLM